METVEPLRREELKRTLAEFRAVLTPEQRQRFDELLQAAAETRARSAEGRAAAGASRRQSPPPGNPPAATNS